MKRIAVLGAASAATLLLLARSAEAKTIDGWLAECVVVGAGSCAEQTARAYARQPISFSTLGSGVTVAANPYTFGQAVSGTIAGRAIYDAPTGGHLLVVLPVATPYAIPSQGDVGDVGALRFTMTALAAYPRAEAYTGFFPAGATLGTTQDGSTVTTGTNESITRGVLAAYLGSIDALPIEVTEVSGFSYQIPAGTSTVDFTGAGTLATGTAILPQAPANGYIQRLECTVTVSTLTLTPGAGTTVVGTVPTSCGPNASHELQYLAPDATWHVLF